MLMMIDPLTALECDAHAPALADALELLACHDLISFDELDRILDDADPMTRLAYDLRYERCPIHHCDIAICSDDLDPECAYLRSILPALLESMPH